MEYEVALYREASPRSIEDGGDGLTVALQNEIPVDQAVPIGTKLQLRATINNESGRGPSLYYVSKMWVGRSRKWPVLMIFSTVLYLC